MGMSSKDFRIFYSHRARSWIIANDYKLRRLIDKGYSYSEAKNLSHGHINNESIGETMKENILGNKRTKSRDLYILKCYIRITDCSYKHYNWVCGLHSTRSNKDQGYYRNINKGPR